MAWKVLLSLLAVHSVTSMAFMPSLRPAKLVQLRGFGIHRKERDFSVKCQLDRIEAKAVEKFTTQYEKLCKTCPSRLQPRVDTIIQLIVGLPLVEREQLFSRIDSEGIRAAASSAGLQADVQNPETSLHSAAASIDSPIIKANSPEMPRGEKMVKDESSELKYKVMKNQRKLAMALQLLSVIDTCTDPDFVSAMAMAKLSGEVGPEYSADANKEFMDELAELQRMSPAARLKRKLKLLEKKAKYERKIFECRMDLESYAEPQRDCVAA